MKKILVTFNNFDRNCPDAYRLLQENGFSFTLSTQNVPYFTYEQLCSEAADADAIIAGLDTFDARVFAHTPRLKIIARMGVGFDAIDLDAARQAGICVTTTRGGNAVAVAEQALASMLLLYRNLAQLDTAMHQNRWPRHVGHELSGKTVGLVGFGAIAQALARLLSGFGVRILACRRQSAPSPAAEALGVTMTDLHTVLRESDVVSLHLPASADNRNLFNAQAFAAMKPGAIFINTARGGLVDSQALLDAVQRGHLAGAAVDVYQTEPPLPSDPLLHDPRILCTPHSASETAESYACCGNMIARQILDVFAGREPENWLNR